MIAALKGEDVILCQIASQARADEYSVRSMRLTSLRVDSTKSSGIRPNLLFTADTGNIVYRAGHFSGATLSETVDRPIAILRQG